MVNLFNHLTVLLFCIDLSRFYHLPEIACCSFLCQDFYKLPHFFVSLLMRIYVKYVELNATTLCPFHFSHWLCFTNELKPTL